MMQENSMRVAIFGNNPMIYEARRIRHELMRRTISYDFISHKRINYTESGIFYGKESLDFSHYTVAFFRSSMYTDERCTFRLENENFLLLQQLLRHGVRVVNQEILRTYQRYNKFVQSQIFARHAVPTPRTLHVNDNAPANVRTALEHVKMDFPIVMKHSAGSLGAKVHYIQSDAALDAALQGRRNKNLIFQEYIPNREDYRVLVIGGKSCGIIKRAARDGEWRNNASLGAAVAVHEDPAMERFAEEICARIGYDNAGVDIILRDNAYVVLEINLTPGFEGFERATGVNVAAKFVDLLCMLTTQSKVRRER